MLDFARDKKIAVLYGGWSSEREVSLRSGTKVYNALKSMEYNAVLIDVDRNLAETLKKSHADIAFIMLHGRPGEDGTIQGMLEILGIPYTGSGVLASSIGMDKFISRMVLHENGFPVASAVLVKEGDDISRKAREIENILTMPVILKPRAEGSSVGAIKIEDRKQLMPSMISEQKKYGDFIVEEFIIGKSVTVGVLGTGSEAFALPVLELRVHGREFYDYVAKYTEGFTEFIVPAELNEDTTKILQDYALRFHRLIGARGFSRVDAMVTEQGSVFILEINTIPGMTDMSDLPIEAEKMGISYNEVVEIILQSSEKQGALL